MKNAVESIRTAVRLPEMLVKKMDEIIEKDGMFSNRPDFIITAVRFNLTNLRHRYLVYLDTNLKNFNENITAEDFLFSVWDGMKSAYGKWGNPTIDLITPPMVLIFLRVPCGLFASWESITSCSTTLDNFQEFVRISVVYYIHHLTDERRIDEHMSNIGKKMSISDLLHMKTDVSLTLFDWNKNR
ncbi:MAG: ribbon-helix-helix domain-containing protein [Candidatus Methanoplasma sp.]|jgi:Arc/MetJ-type ribon-helix-helix transcriptional regulator|nr:ribbon-helix-helix domain-containing protein [Candidatus Methanoplasma sp.]